MRTFASVVLFALLVVAAVAQQKSLPPIPMEGAPDIEILGAFIRASDAEGRPNFSVEIKNAGILTSK